MPRRLVFALSILGLVAPAMTHDGVHSRLEAVDRRIDADPGNADLYLERGEVHRGHGDFAAALVDFARCATLAPDRVEVDFHRGRALRQAGRPSAALTALDRFLGALDATFIDGDGTVRDTFTIMKTDEPNPADLNGDGGVDGADLGSLLANWGVEGGYGPADLDGSGTVDGADLGLLLAAWN